MIDTKTEKEILLDNITRIKHKVKELEDNDSVLVELKNEIEKVKVLKNSEKVPSKSEAEISGVQKVLIWGWLGVGGTLILGALAIIIGAGLGNDSGMILPLIPIPLAIFIYHSVQNVKLNKLTTEYEEKLIKYEKDIQAFEEEYQELAPKIQVKNNSLLNSIRERNILSIPIKYLTSGILEKFEEYLRNLRTDTLKECINLYELEKGQRLLNKNVKEIHQVLDQSTYEALQKVN